MLLYSAGLLETGSEESQQLAVEVVARAAAEYRTFVQVRATCDAVGFACSVV